MDNSVVNRDPITSSYHFVDIFELYSSLISNEIMTVASHRKIDCQSINAAIYYQNYERKEYRVTFMTAYSI